MHRLRRLVLLVAAAAAFAAPAAAQASPTWYVGGEEIPSGKENSVPLTMTGTWLVQQPGAMYAECNMTFEGQIWNDGTAQAEVDSVKFNTGGYACVGSPCAWRSGIANASPSKPWLLSTASGAEGVTGLIPGTEVVVGNGEACSYPGYAWWGKGDIPMTWDNETATFNITKTNYKPPNYGYLWLTGAISVVSPVEVTLE